MANNEQDQAFQPLKGACGAILVVSKLCEFSWVVEYYFIYYMHWFEYCCTYKSQVEIWFSLGWYVLMWVYREVYRILRRAKAFPTGEREEFQVSPAPLHYVLLDLLLLC